MRKKSAKNTGTNQGNSKRHSGEKKEKSIKRETGEEKERKKKGTDKK